jgi:hypothetical protein
MSVPQSNSIQTIESPTAVADRTRRTPAAPFTAASMGKVTWLSTSLGAMPGASVRTVTVGAVRSGNTSTGIRNAVYPPRTSNSPAITSTAARFRNDHRMRASIMAAS